MRLRLLLGSALAATVIASGACDCEQTPDLLFRCDEQGQCPGGAECFEGYCYPPVDGGVPFALAFNNTPLTIAAGACSPPLTVELRSDAGTAAMRNTVTEIALAAN